SPDPRQWPHVASGVTYRRAIRELAEFFGSEPTEASLYEHRSSADPAEYASALLRATRTELLLVDDGYPPPGEGTSWDELGELADCSARPVLRIERVAEEAGEHGLERLRAEIAGARSRGFVALKTIAAYRGGLDLDALTPSTRTDRVEGARVRYVLLAALEA